MNSNQLRVAGTVTDSIVDGPGLRFTLFVQGCPHHCPGCHNADTHDFNGGKLMSIEEVFQQIEADKGITGVTFSGGEPFSQASKLVKLAELVKRRGLDLAIYSGWTFEQLTSGIIPGAKELLQYADILIDGKFELGKKSMDISFRGSTNQRILDVKKSLLLGGAVKTTDPQWLGKEAFSTDEFAPKDIKTMGW